MAVTNADLAAMIVELGKQIAELQDVIASAPVEDETTAPPAKRQHAPPTTHVERIRLPGGRMASRVVPNR